MIAKWLVAGLLIGMVAPFTVIGRRRAGDDLDSESEY